jgi:hypothetical protein
MSKPLVSRLFPALALILTLCGCEQLGVETPAQTAARQEAEGKAVGGACRHAGRALEDCYKSSPKISKAAIYTGWRDMDTYMRENKIEVVPTQDAKRRAEQQTERDKGEETATPDTGKPEEEKSNKPAGKQS